MKPDCRRKSAASSGHRHLAPRHPGVRASAAIGTVMPHCTLVRSDASQREHSHAAAVYTSLTGHDRGEVPGGGHGPQDHPSSGRRWRCCGRRPRPLAARGAAVHDQRGWAAAAAGLFRRVARAGYDPLLSCRIPTGRISRARVDACRRCLAAAVAGRRLLEQLDEWIASPLAAVARRWTSFSGRADLLTSRRPGRRLRSTRSRQPAPPTAAIFTGRACCWRGG